MIPLSLFSDRVCDTEKKLIVEAIIQSGDDWSVRGIKCPAELNNLEKRYVIILILFCILEYV